MDRLGPTHPRQPPAARYPTQEILLESCRQPNLATRCLGLALRELPDYFEGKYGYRPLLAESFSDPELHEGTIYKASNWTPLGLSKGFKRHKSEFYIDEKRPKKYWIYPLRERVRRSWFGLQGWS